MAREQICDEALCLHICDLAVNGNDLKELGLSNRQIGEGLKLLLDAVIEEKTVNEKDSLLDYLKESLNE